jgi:hypothetical protein
MAYARFGWRDSDVYVFCNVSGYLDCCACSFDEESRFTSTDAMIEHLRRHIAAGHTVPEDTFVGLEEDREDNEAYFAERAAGSPPQHASGFYGDVQPEG